MSYDHERLLSRLMTFCHGLDQPKAGELGILDSHMERVQACLRAAQAEPTLPQNEVVDQYVDSGAFSSTSGNMPLFRRSLRRFDDQTTRAKKKQLRGEKKLQKWPGILSKRRKPLIDFEDTSGVSPRNSLSGWEMLKQETIELATQAQAQDCGVLTTSTKVKLDTSGFFVDRQSTKGVSEGDSDIRKKFKGREHRALKKLNVVEKKPMPSEKQTGIRAKPVLEENRDVKSEVDQINTGIDEKQYVEIASYSARTDNVRQIFMKQRLSGLGGEEKNHTDAPFDELNSQDSTKEDPRNGIDDLDPNAGKNSHSIAKLVNDFEQDADTVFLTYSQSSSECTTGDADSEMESQINTVEDKEESEPRHHKTSQRTCNDVVEESAVNDTAGNSEDAMSDPMPSDGVCGYVSLNRVHDTSNSDRSDESSTKQVRSEEEKEEAKWHAKSNFATPLGATSQEIDALNRFLSVVGPNFNGRDISFADRKNIYDNARKVGLNKVMVNKFLDQSAGLAAVGLPSTVSDLSACSTYSSSPNSLRLAKSASSDDSSVSGTTKESENMSYYSLPRTSPQTDVDFRCADTLKKYFWTGSKMTGKELLESLGAVVIGDKSDNDSVHLEA
eukprot:scaffold22596_cov131-Cylindrotheca_fusiformis.AAC.17